MTTGASVSEIEGETVGNREGKTLGLVDDGAMVGAEEELGVNDGNKL